MIVYRNGQIDYQNQTENPKVDPRKYNHLTCDKGVFEFSGERWCIFKGYMDNSYTLKRKPNYIPSSHHIQK